MNTLTSQSRWRPAIIWLTVLIAAVFPWTAGPVSPAHADSATVLAFGVLPASQGWAYSSSDPSPQSTFFSVDGSQLHMSTMGSGHHGHAYTLTTPIDPQRPFTLSVRARVTAYEDQSGANPYGFMFAVMIGDEQFDVGVSPVGIRGGAGDHFFATTVDVTQFHDYRVVGQPGVGFQLFIDGVSYGSNAPRAMATNMTMLYLGDGTAGANANADIEQFDFTQSSPGCAGTPAGLVSLWRGEGSGADTQAANNAIARGGVTYVAGKYGSAFNFDGLDDDLLIPASTSLQLENAFTLEFWFSFPHDVVPGTPGFFQGTHFLNKDWTDFLSIANNMGNIELGSAHPRLLSTTISWLANTWYHAAITYDAGQYHMYVDGGLEHSLFRPDPLLGDLEDMYFSHSLATPFNPPMWWRHRLDEIAVYDRALTAAEVADRAGICPPTDSTPPVISITSPGATGYLLNEHVPAAYACEDTESGIASCTGQVPNSLPIDTSVVGPRSFTVTSADNAGNTAALTAAYTVAYKTCLLYNPAKVAKKGSTIPIKVQLCDSDNINVSAASVVITAQSITQISTATSGPVEDAGNANPDNNFRFDPTLGDGGGYIYNMSTQPLAKGSYTLDFTVGAQTAMYHLPFQVQ